MRLALLSPLPPEPSRVAQHAAQFRRSLNQGGIDVLTPLVGQRPLENLAQARAWVAERDWRGVDVVHAELAPGQRSIYWVMQALATLPQAPALSITAHAAPDLLGQPLGGVLSRLHHASWAPDGVRKVAKWLSVPRARLWDRRLAKRLSGMLCGSDAQAQALAKRLKFPRERITVIPLGMPTEGRQPLPPEPLRLLCLSAPGQSERALRDVLTAVQAAQADEALAVRPWSVTFAGTTVSSRFEQSWSDPLAVAQRDPLAKELATRLTWALDLEPEDVTALVAQHHALVLPEPDRRWGVRGEEPGLTSPQVVRVMAAAAGRPILLASKAASAEGVAFGNGAVYPMRDAASLGQLVKDVLMAGERWQEWRDRAQTLAGHLDAATLTQRHVGFFQQVARQRGR